MFWLNPDCRKPCARQATAHDADAVVGARDGRPWLAFGTPGGDKQDQWSLVVLLHTSIMACHCRRQSTHRCSTRTTCELVLAARYQPSTGFG